MHDTTELPELANGSLDRSADGYHLAFWIAAGLVAAAIAVAGTVLRPGD